MSKKIYVIILSLSLLICGACSHKDNYGIAIERVETTIDSDVYDAIIDHTYAKISTVSVLSETEGIAQITVTMPDIVLIYDYLLSNGTDCDSISTEALKREIIDCTNNEDLSSSFSFTAEVIKDGRKWLPKSYDFIIEELRRQINEITIRRINAIGIIEVETGEALIWEGIQ